MDKLLQLLTQLTPLAAKFAPGVGAAPEIVAAVAALIKHIKEQSGKTTDQILADADANLDANDKMLVEDRIRLGM